MKKGTAITLGILNLIILTAYLGFETYNLFKLANLSFLLSGSVALINIIVTSIVLAKYNS